MQKIKQGDTLRAIFTQPLPGKEIAPNLKQNSDYECKGVFTDKLGNDHIDVGLPHEVGFVTSFATGEVLPGNTHWCHPNRFLIIKSA